MANLKEAAVKWCLRLLLTGKCTLRLVDGRCDELSISLTMGVPRRAVKTPIPAVKEAVLRDALIARRVTPVKSTAPSKSREVFYFLCQHQYAG